MFKQSLLALALAGAIYAVPAMAQNSAPSAPPADQQMQNGGEMHHHGPMMDPVKRTEHLTKKLDLTADQQTKVLEIFKTEQSQAESMMNDSSMSRDDRHAKMAEMHKTSDDQVRALLDPTQQKKWDEMQSQRGQWGGHHRDGQAKPDQQ
ncbi:MAG: hypothetical protein WCB53_00205 [Terriglobales bacterium]